MIKKITFITNNQRKLLHAQEVFDGLGWKVVSKKLDLIEPREEDPKKVSVEKAIQAFKMFRQPLMVEDSGIFIKSLNGFPKTFVHFVESSIGVENIVKMMDGVVDRTAEFRQSLSYIEPGMKYPKVFSYVDGGYKIADRVWKPKYKSHEFDRIMIPPGENKPLCMFDKKWRAKRDYESNKGTVHYQQLADYLTTK